MQLQQIGLVTDRQALLPAALEIDGVIRLFVGIPDADFRCSIYTIDVNPHDPSEVLVMGEGPVLGIGEPGMFDCDGIVPAYVFRPESKIAITHLIYSGFQRLEDVKFGLFTGHAYHLDFWERKTFERMHKTPLLDRSDASCLIRAGASVEIKETWRFWYASGDRFHAVNGIKHPRYQIAFSYGYNGVFEYVCLSPEGDEYRIGKPHVWNDGGYHMLCTAYALPDNRSYLVYATSPDGLDWQRQPFSITGDVFPSTIYAYRCGGWVFFNGTGRGEGGVGYGRLVD